MACIHGREKLSRGEEKGGEKRKRKRNRGRETEYIRIIDRDLFKREISYIISYHIEVIMDAIQDTINSILEGQIVCIFLSLSLSSIIIN